MRRDLKTHVRWGMKWGLAFAVALALYVAILYAVAGSGPFDRVGFSPGLTIAVYVMASLTAGLVVGLLRPLTSSREGSMAVGVVAALPGSFALNLGFFGPVSRWSVGDWFQLVLGAVMFGAALGYIWHRPS